MPAASDKPKVFILLTDGQGCGDLSCMGNPVPHAVARTERRGSDRRFGRRAALPYWDYRQMGVYQKSFAIATRGRCDVLDITAEVARAVSESRIAAGIVNVSGRGSTLGITTIEFESGCLADLRRALEQIAPTNSDYAHNARWGDNNGYSHLRSALMGTAKSFPVAGGKLAVGSWQQIVLCDFDERAREREITVTVVGE